eukprot:184553-Pleurochrysis_carterae.AAC.2
MVTAMVADGKRVLVVAKVRTALAVLTRQLKRLAPKLPMLSSEQFLQKSDSRLRALTDGANAIANDERLREALSQQEAACFWPQSAVSTACAHALSGVRYGQAGG